MEQWKFGILTMDEKSSKNNRNQWEIVEKKYGGQKLVLKNIDHPDVIIHTISAWKTHRLESKN